MKQNNDWDKVKKSKGESEFLKVTSGQDISIRILSGPMAYGQIGYGVKPNFRSLNIPFGSQVPGYKVKNTYAFEVLVLDGQDKGKHKMLCAGPTVADQLKGIREKWGDLSKADISIGKVGEDLSTRWHSIPCPASAVAESDLKPVFDLGEKIVFATKEQLDALPPPVVSKTQPKDALNNPISAEQGKFISNLATQKEMSLSAVEKLIQRKFEKKTLDELSSAEAAQLIDTLKAL